jgi:CRP-like cAMP-binding protein
MISLDKSLLGNIEYFNSLSDKELEEILKAPENGIVEFAYKDTIFHENDIGEYMYIMLDGQAEVYVHSNTTYRDISISSIKPGNHFGDGSVTSKEEVRRSATIKATLDSKLFKIHKKYVLRALQNKNKPASNLPPDKARDTVTRIPLFNGLNDDEIINFRNWVTIVEYKKNDFIFKQGMPADNLYIVLEGSVDTIAKDANGNVKIITSMQSGEYFGELELLPDSTKKYNHYARTNEDSQIIKVPKSIFTAMLDRNTKLRIYINKMNKLRQLKMISKSNVASLNNINKLKDNL